MFLAIDWDDAECRYAAATFRKEKINVHHLGTVPIEEEQSESSFFAISMSILALCRKERIGSCPLLVSLGRNQVEWLPLSLPPCKESEIPLLLQNQVLREISGSSESDSMDYLLLPSSSAGHQVLAFILSQPHRKSLPRALRSLGHKPVRIGLRAVQAAELVLQNKSILEGEPSEHRLIVNAVRNDADLILIADERIAAIRSFRLPDDHQQTSLTDEIKRTLTIGLNGRDPLPIRHIILFGEGKETEWCRCFEQDNLSVQVLNPLTLPNVSVSKNVQVRDVEKYASLIGSLIVQSRRIKPSVDFLHPKEAPKPISYTRPVLLALLLLGIICLGLFQWNSKAVNELKLKRDSLKEEHQKIAGELQQLMPIWNTLRYTHLWETQNIVWLDVLNELTVVLPGSADLVASQMSFTTGPINNDPRLAGSISLSGMVRDPSVLQKLQSDLHASNRYWMRNPEPSPNPAGGGYPWLFRTTIYCLKR